MKLVSLAWVPDGIQLAVDGALRTYSFPQAAEHHYWLALDGRVPGALYLRSSRSDAPLSRIHTAGAEPGDVAPVPLPPGGDLSPFDWKLHPRTGWVSVPAGEVLWVHDGAGWTARPLPRDIVTRDVSFDAAGGLWCAGSVASNRLPDQETEAAIRYQTGPGVPFAPRPLVLGPIDAWRVVNGGGLTELQSIDAEADPIVAASHCAWFLEDESSFLFALTPSKAVVQRLAQEVVRAIDRSARLRVHTCQGGVWAWDRGRFRRRSIMQALLTTLRASGRHLLVRALDAVADCIAVAVEVAPAGRQSAAGPPDFTAICVSDDGGASFAELRRAPFSTGPEWCGVAWLR